jgi:hypothetical protein
VAAVVHEYFGCLVPLTDLHELRVGRVGLTEMSAEPALPLLNVLHRLPPWLLDAGWYSKVLTVPMVTGAAGTAAGDPGISGT